MTNTKNIAARPWPDSDWHAEVETWLTGVLRAKQIIPIGSASTVHERPWSIILRQGSSAGDLFFKAVHPALRNETAVTNLLAGVVGEEMPHLLGSDVERGWLLLGDGGPTLRAAFTAGRPPDTWRQVLARYAELQKALVTHSDDLLAQGAADRRPRSILPVYQQLVSDPPASLLGEKGLLPEELARLQTAVASVQERFAELEACGLPHSIEHGDLHDANIFYSTRPYFFDWGDSAVSHPFFSLRTVFVSMENTFGLEEGDPFCMAMVDDYLASWATVVGETATACAYELAQRLWALNTLAKYAHLEEQIGPGAFNPAVLPSLLREFLAANPEF